VTETCQRQSARVSYMKTSNAPSLVSLEHLFVRRNTVSVGLVHTSLLAELSWVLTGILYYWEFDSCRIDMSCGHPIKGRTLPSAIFNQTSIYRRADGRCFPAHLLAIFTAWIMSLIIRLPVIWIISRVSGIQVRILLVVRTQVNDRWSKFGETNGRNRFVAHGGLISRLPSLVVKMSLEMKQEATQRFLKRCDLGCARVAIFHRGRMAPQPSISGDWALKGGGLHDGILPGSHDSE
jgi:hypothetical protein